MISWMKLASDMMLLSLESQRVVSLRLAAFAIGGARAHAEAQRMIHEKFFAASRAAQLMAFGRSPEAIVRHYRSHVRANQRRLSRSVR